MSAWGSGPFDNDEAMDFVGEIADAPSSETERLLRAALAAVVDDDGYLEASTGTVAVAAAGFLAAASGAYDVSSDAVADLVVERRMEAPDELRDLAEEALARVVGSDSEWRELWEQTDELEEALGGVRAIREALGS